VTTFSTPEPISVTLEFGFGDARIIASDRDDTVVQVRPSDASHQPDMRAVEQTRVEYAAGRLLVKATKSRGLGLFAKPGSIDVTIDVPACSNLQGDAAVAAFRGVGQLGECRVKAGAGDIQFDETGTLDLNTGGGAIVVDRVLGRADVSSGSGQVRIRDIAGAAVIKLANGDCWVGTTTGALRVSAANGDISVDHAHADITAHTAGGDVRIGDVARGSASLKTACGEIEISIRSGSAARLDVHTSFGRVRNHMDRAESPDASDERIDVRARTGYGDILIHRAEGAMP